MKLLKMAIWMALPLLLSTLGSAHAGTCAKGYGVTGQGITKDQAMVAAIIDGLRSLQEKSGEEFQTHHFPSKIKYTEMQTDSFDSVMQGKRSSYHLVSITSLSDMLIKGDTNVLSLHGSPSHYITSKSILISPKADQLEFNIVEKRGDRYLYSLGDYWGFGAFKEIDGTIESHLCNINALEPKYTGLVVDARSLRVKKGYRFQLVDSKGKRIYKGKMAVLKASLDWRGHSFFHIVDKQHKPDVGWWPKVVQAKKWTGKNKLYLDHKALSGGIGLKTAIDAGHVAVMLPSDKPTGLIIEVKDPNKDLELLPKIFSASGKEIKYKQGDGNHPVTDYATSISDAKKMTRLGAHPVIIKALKVNANNHIILSNYDFERLLKLKGIKKVLKNIVIVLEPRTR